MKILCEPQGMMGANCYMFSSDKTAILIDPSALTSELSDFLHANREKQLFIIATHRHCDHIAAIPAIKEQFGGSVCISAEDACGLASMEDSLGSYLGIFHAAISPDIILKEGDVTLGDITLKVLKTPGHTEGSICIITPDALFSGDTLFHLSIGRTDFPSGSLQLMQQSLTKLFALKTDYTVYPGHGETTTLFYEQIHNPYYIREF